MSSSPSYEDLALWEDLTIPAREPDDDETFDPRRTDPRQLPAEISRIDRTIAELEQRLSDLKLERERLLDQRALIHRLPPEVLSRVFEVRADETLEPANLGYVCRRWRDVSLACPVLWSYIILNSNWGWRIQAFLRKLRAHLRRSQTFKLYVDLDFRYVDNYGGYELVMAELKSELSRCYWFEVWVSDWSRMRVVQENAIELGPALEDLHLRMSADQSEVEEPFLVLTHPCPRLAHVTLEQVPLEAIAIPMPALRQLCLLPDEGCHASTRIAYPFRELMSMITASPLKWLNLNRTVFALDSTEDLFDATPTLNELPNLKGISFDVVHSNSIILFLQSTSLPSLSLVSAYSAEDMQWLTHIALAPERFPSLRLLDLRNFNLNGAGIVPFVRALHQLPQLTGLGLASPAPGIVGGRLFEVLARVPDIAGGWLLPRLEAICLQNCSDISGYELLRVVDARRGAADVAKISYLQLSQCYLVHPEALDQLTILVDTVRNL